MENHPCCCFKFQMKLLRVLCGGWFKGGTKGNLAVFCWWGGASLWRTMIWTPTGWGPQMVGLPLLRNHTTRPPPPPLRKGVDFWHPTHQSQAQPIQVTKVVQDMTSGGLLLDAKAC